MGSLEIDDSRAADGLRRATATLGGEKRTFFFQRLDGPLNTTAGADPFVLATLLLWSRNAEQLHVAGSVTKRLLRGLEEWQGAWARWKPDRYRVVHVSADEVLDGYPKDGPAITAFSGGVDSTYTLHRHLHGLAGNTRAPIEAGLLVQGFDIPLEDVDVFARVQNRAAAFLAEQGVTLMTVRSDVRQLGQDWEDGFALLVAAALALFAPAFSVGLIPSGEPYDELVLPWGSSPVTDHLLSTGLMDVRHDGAVVGRTDKVAALLSWPQGVRQLRVCWEGEQLDRNCGRCEKCIRTACNFFAAGDLNPSCFRQLPTSEQIRSLRIRKAITLNELGGVLRYAERNGSGRGAWFNALQGAVRRNNRSLLVRRTLPAPVQRVARGALDLGRKLTADRG
jgi:hypothetical protein